MLPLNHIYSALTREERLRLNENWDIITSGINNLQTQLNAVFGGEVKALIDQINKALADSEHNVDELVTLMTRLDDKIAETNTTISQANAAKNSANTATAQANTATTNTNTATAQANTARDLANTATAQANTARDLANASSASAQGKINDITQAITNVTSVINNATTKLTTFNTDSAAKLSKFDTDASVKLTKVDTDVTTKLTAFYVDSSRAIEEVETATQNATTATVEAKAVTSNLAGYDKPIVDFVLSASYTKHQPVRYNGSTYRAKLTTTGNPLPASPSVENTWWTLEAQRGVDGEGSVGSVNGIMPGSDGNVVLPIPQPADPSWTAIKDKPIFFAPSTHSHTVSQISNFPTTMTPSAHTHAYADITGKPTTFTPSTHTHTVSQISNFPITMAPSEHAHDYASITSKPTTFTPSAHMHYIDDVTGLRDALNSTGTGGSVALIGSPERKIQHFTATANQTVFTLSSPYPVGKNLSEVIVGGVSQFAPANYTETSSTTITLGAGVPVGTVVTVLSYTGFASSGDIVNASTSERGLVKLETSFTSDSETTAATPKAVKQVAATAATHATNSSNPHGVTKTQVGLSNVDNVQQASKTEFNTHVGKIASTTELGHIKPDGTTITVNPSTGVASVIVADNVNDIEQAIVELEESIVNMYRLTEGAVLKDATGVHLDTLTQTGFYTAIYDSIVGAQIYGYPATVHPEYRLYIFIYASPGGGILQKFMMDNSSVGINSYTRTLLERFIEPRWSTWDKDKIALSDSTFSSSTETAASSYAVLQLNNQFSSSSWVPLTPTAPFVAASTAAECFAFRNTQTITTINLDLSLTTALTTNATKTIGTLPAFYRPLVTTVFYALVVSSGNKWMPVMISEEGVITLTTTAAVVTNSTLKATVTFSN